jgi:hypothetical protein
MVVESNPCRAKFVLLTFISILQIIIIIQSINQSINLRGLSASELYRPSDRRMSEKLVPTFADRGCRVVSATDPYGRILGFLDRLLLLLLLFILS